MVSLPCTCPAELRGGPTYSQDCQAHTWAARGILGGPAYSQPLPAKGSSAPAREGDAEVLDETGAPVKRNRYPLTQGWVKHRLINELAIAAKPQTQLATEYGVSEGAISMFKRREMTAIERKRENLADEYSDLWIASKRNRLAELQQAAEKLAINPSARDAEVLARLLKDAAEELGDIPNKPGVQINQANVTYSIEGVSLDDLR